MASTSTTALNPRKRSTLDPSKKLTSDQLKAAAVTGDVEFVMSCVDNDTPHTYYFTLFESEPISKHRKGNIFHVAIRFLQLNFIEQVIGVLPVKVVHQLLLQPTSGLLHNPLHYAASLGHIKAVDLILRFCESDPSLFENDDQKPWLQRDSLGQSPCHTAIVHHWEDCALEILNMDIQKLSSNYFVNFRGDGLLYAALREGLEEVALQILKNSSSFNCSGYGNLTPLHMLPFCSGGQKSLKICSLLIKKRPSLVIAKSKIGSTILHFWAQEGKVWPFQCLLNCKELFPGDLNRVLVDLMSASCTANIHYSNAFHFLANRAPDEQDAVKIAKILIKAFNHVLDGQPFQPSNKPWLVKDMNGDSSIQLSLMRKYQSLAKYIIGESRDLSMGSVVDILLFAIKCGCQEVAEMMLNEVVKEKWIDLKDGAYFNALHYAPHCNDEFVGILIDGNPKLIEGISTRGLTVLHSWMIEGKVWPFRYILQRAESDFDCREKLIGVFKKIDLNVRTVFHYAAQYYHEKTTTEIVKLLANGYKKLYPPWYKEDVDQLPWFQIDFNDDGALHAAIKCQHETLAMEILSLHHGNSYHEILDMDKLKCKTLFLAMENNCYRVAKKIMGGLNKQSWTPYLEDSTNRQNILHFLPNSTDEEFGKWLVEKTPEFITKQDTSGITPLNKASDAGVDWLVRAMLSTDPISIFRDAPLAWVDACMNGHVSTVRTFINCHPGSFKDHCVGYKISPLHHIKLNNVRSYEDFLKLPYMMDLINLQDSEGATPLHAAIRIEDIHLTEALLKISDTLYKIKDDKNETARSLLQKKYKEDKNWKKMCRDIEFDPNIKTSYLQRKTNLLDVRNTLSVVAALLATITFTAGFTLPGGLNQETGEAMLAKKAAFVVFMMADTVALCCSMSVLICLIWSIIQDSSRSMLLIDRSMNLLMISLLFTMIAFMCGVFMVISQKSMWVAIVVIVKCSVLTAAIIVTLLYRPVKSVIRKAKNNGRGQAGSPV